VGGSVGVSALVVGTTLLALLAAGTVSMLESSRSAADIASLTLPSAEIDVVNASHNGTALHINITNSGDEAVELSHAYLALDGERVRKLSGFISGSEWIFPGETIHINAATASAPSRISVSSWGYTSVMTVT